MRSESYLKFLKSETTSYSAANPRLGKPKLAQRGVTRKTVHKVSFFISSRALGQWGTFNQNSTPTLSTNQHMEIKSTCRLDPTPATIHSFLYDLCLISLIFIFNPPNPIKHYQVLIIVKLITKKIKDSLMVDHDMSLV